MTPVSVLWIKLLAIGFLISLCLAPATTQLEVHHHIVIVAQDGSGKYRSIQEAINAVPKHRHSRERNQFVIQVKAGTYHESISVGRHLHNLSLIGDGIGRTIVISNPQPRRRKSATLRVDAPGFSVRGITFRNAANPRRRAPVLHSSSDKATFYQCSFEGHHDTLTVHSKRQFFRECIIYGSSNIISGSAAAVFQKCTIYVTKGATRRNAITYHARRHRAEHTGFSILDSSVLPAPDLVPFVHQYKTYLGRPGGKYSRVVFVKTNLHGFIDPKGWYPRHGSNTTVYYGEYGNYGAGARTTRRVKWLGYHVMSGEEASQFTVERFIGGQSWLPATNIPFDLRF